MTIFGSCLCGGVRFSIERALAPMEYCHCNRCRKVSGSSAMLAVSVRREDYRFIAGHELLRTYSAPILYEPPAYQVCFCARCGSCVPPANPESESFEIAAGLLDGDLGLLPDKHIFVECAPDWARPLDSLPRYTMRQLHALRTGHELAATFVQRAHRGEHEHEPEP